MSRLSVCVGFPLWKRPHVRPFLEAVSSNMKFVDDSLRAVKYAKAGDGRIIIWASLESTQFTARAKGEGIDVIRLEDGFLRSVGLGSDFYVPYSLVLDRKGIYYDPSGPSELESILEKGVFDGKLIERARHLRQEIIKRQITKYNMGSKTSGALILPSNRLLVLVPGQVENDASILRGASDVDTNLKLLRAVRKKRPDAFILFKPHPDVLAGNRPGHIPPAIALGHCDLVVGNISAGTLIDMVDEVHTIGSLTGFEALLRNKSVHTYGGPFYAGWELTHDRGLFLRRTRRITIDQLVAATLILYPTYFDWETNSYCEPETVLDRLAAQPAPSLKSGRISKNIGRLIRLSLNPYMRKKC